MALNFLVILTLLKFGLSAPDPNVKVDVNVEVEDNGSNCCSDKSCIFGGVVYPHKCYLKDSCLELQCIDGTWKFKGINEEKGCGECKVTGDPHFNTFDKLPNQPDPFGYLLDKNGTYTITQPDFAHPALFGVKGNFEICTYVPPFNGSCIDEITYHEAGISISLVLPPAGPIAEGCVTWDGNPASNPACAIKAFVNGNNIGQVGHSVQEVFGGYGGPILIFKHKRIGGWENRNCITIVGTKGLSVSLCEHEDNYPYMYIWAMPSLKSDPSTLYGLCNTFTGVTPAQNIGFGNGTVVPTDDCWDETTQTMCDGFAQSWE